MSEQVMNRIESPRAERREGRIIAGMRGRYNMKTASEIPGQWKMFAPYIGKLEGAVGKAAYGVVVQQIPPDKFDYVSGVEVTDRERVPAPLMSLVVPAYKYLIFPHRDHLSKLKDTISAIWREYLPASNYKVAEKEGVPSMIEFYGEDFDPVTGMGTMELWIPIE